MKHAVFSAFSLASLLASNVVHGESPGNRARILLCASLSEWRSIEVPDDWIEALAVVIFSIEHLSSTTVVSSKSCVKDHFPHSLDVPVDVYEGLNSCLDGSSPDFKCSTNINGGNTEL